MSTYVIGDVQGCYDELIALLAKIDFNPEQDQLIFVGDLVNRGSKSLEVLRFIKNLGKSAHVVLGNHDLYCMSIVYGYIPTSKAPSLHPLLQAPDKYELIDWLRNQHFLYQHGNHIITHAGIPPIWSVNEAKQYALELESILQSDKDCQTLLLYLLGNEPNCWNNSLTGIERWRCLINYFTRMRICKADGMLNLEFKGSLNDIPSGYDAWFNFPNTKLDQKNTLVFGHWAALKGQVDRPNIIATDTGCLWGGHLSAYCIENKAFYRTKSHM